MVVTHNKTEKALLARGVQSDLARDLTRAGHTIASLKSKSIEELCSFGLPETIAKDIRSGRTPIPETVLAKLLFDNKWICCVCRSQTEPVVVHHIVPWAKSRSHDAENLIVLCPNDHAKAHTKGDLNQNFSPERLRSLKKQWEDKVKVDDSIVIRRAAQTVGESWHYFNLLRLCEIATDTAVDFKQLKTYKNAFRAGVLDANGGLIPEKSDSMYAYSGVHSILRYSYAKEFFLKILNELSVTNISDRFDKCDLGYTVIRNDIIYIEGAFNFKQLNVIVKGPDQLVQGTRSANSIKIVFTFDRWYATSCSSHSLWLTGRQVAGCFCKVTDIAREEGKIIIKCSVLAICSGLPGQRSRSYMSASTPINKHTWGDEDDSLTLSNGWGFED
ncbi:MULTISPECIES: HNH endonuclease signature motif containing protein [Enterobacterales]|uniref:HNH endonuclease signature motif containing protein n=1 Tax=Enterobacterales TaxID=91347 RepID=UPI002EDB8BC7